MPRATWSGRKRFSTGALFPLNKGRWRRHDAFCLVAIIGASGEDVYAAYEQTDAGRYVIVFFIYKAANAALILSACDMDAKERSRYERK